MHRDMAVTELDDSLEWVANTIAREVAAVVISGESIPPDEIAHRFLDLPLGSAADTVSELLNALASNADSDDEEAEQVRVDAEVALANTFEDLDRALWELLDIALSDPSRFSHADLTRQVLEALAEHRPFLIEQFYRLPSASQSPASSSTADELGVVLPIARRRR